MEDLLKLMQAFEKRNNISIALDLCSDGSGILKAFWDDEEILDFSKSSELQEFLTNGRLKTKDNHSIKPIEIL